MIRILEDQREGPSTCGWTYETSNVLIFQNNVLEAIAIVVEGIGKGLAGLNCRQHNCIVQFESSRGKMKGKLI